MKAVEMKEARVFSQWEDTALECLSCKYDVRTSENTKGCRRKVSLHALHHGTITISVNDFPVGTADN